MERAMGIEPTREIRNSQQNPMVVEVTGEHAWSACEGRDLFEIRDKLSYAIVSADTFMSALSLR
jgi:hypothetical protein